MAAQGSLTAWTGRQDGLSQAFPPKTYRLGSHLNLCGQGLIPGDPPEHSAGGCQLAQVNHIKVLQHFGPEFRTALHKLKQEREAMTLQHHQSVNAGPMKPYSASRHAKTYHQTARLVCHLADVFWGAAQANVTDAHACQC